MGINKLSDEDIKTLQTFSMYIQSYGSKVARTSIEVGWEGDVYFDIYGWSGDGSRITIPTYDSIDELIERVITTEDLVDKYFDSESRGNITAIVNANSGSLTFSAEIYVQNEDPVGGEIESEDIPEEVLSWMRECKDKGYTSGQIHYEGGGDDGYMENIMYVDDGVQTKYPEMIEEWLVRRVTDYGDWYNNDGGHGDVYISFKSETVTIQGGLYYEDSDTVKIDYYGLFK